MKPGRDEATAGRRGGADQPAGRLPLPTSFCVERLGWKYRGKIESEGSRASAPKSDHQAGEPFAGESTKSSYAERIDD